MFSMHLYRLSFANAISSKECVFICLVISLFFMLDVMVVAN